jgi:hypothetical protein
LASLPASHIILFVPLRFSPAVAPSQAALALLAALRLIPILSVFAAPLRASSVLVLRLVAFYNAPRFPVANVLLQASLPGHFSFVRLLESVEFEVYSHDLRPVEA